MDTVAEAISDLTYAFEALQAQLTDLTEAEMTEAIVDPENGYTFRDILAHLAGWEDYVLEVLPVMLATIDNQLPAVDAAKRNRQALSVREGRLVAEILAEFEQKHRQIVDLLKATSPKDLTLRRTQRGMIFTIKSYVVDVMKNHIVEHVEQLKVWRAGTHADL
jgi:hypothetical protein